MGFHGFNSVKDQAAQILIMSLFCLHWKGGKTLTPSALKMCPDHKNLKAAKHLRVKQVWDTESQETEFPLYGSLLWSVSGKRTHYQVVHSTWKRKQAFTYLSTAHTGLTKCTLHFLYESIDQGQTENKLSVSETRLDYGNINKAVSIYHNAGVLCQYFLKEDAGIWRLEYNTIAKIRGKLQQLKGQKVEERGEEALSEEM